MTISHTTFLLTTGIYSALPVLWTCGAVFSKAALRAVAADLLEFVFHVAPRLVFRHAGKGAKGMAFQHGQCRSSAFNPNPDPKPTPNPNPNRNPCLKSALSLSLRVHCYRVLSCSVFLCLALSFSVSCSSTMDLTLSPCFSLSVLHFALPCWIFFCVPVSCSVFPYFALSACLLFLFVFPLARLSRTLLQANIV